MQLAQGSATDCVQVDYEHAIVADGTLFRATRARVDYLCCCKLRLQSQWRIIRL